jgi:hypothetical protein
MRDPLTAMYLPNFNIFDPDVKYLVGLLCARNGSGATSIILEYTGTMDIWRLIPLLIAHDSHGNIADKSGESPL